MPTHRTTPAPREAAACTMSVLNDEKSRTDLLHRLKRAEGQLRDVDSPLGRAVLAWLLLRCVGLETTGVKELTAGMWC